MEEYLVWSCKLMGWWGKGSVYVSDIEQAKHFTQEEAVAFCKSRYGKTEKNLSAIPVPFPLLEEIRK